MNPFPTPGPWYFERQGTSLHIMAHPEHEAACVVAQVDGYGTAGDGAEAEANARLLAAAPALLAAVLLAESLVRRMTPTLADPTHHTCPQHAMCVLLTTLQKALDAALGSAAEETP